MSFEKSDDPGFRLYCLLAMFDFREDNELSHLVRAAREGYERSDPDMGADENAEAWDEFDARWGRYDSAGRNELVRDWRAAWATRQRDIHLPEPKGRPLRCW